MHLRKLDLHLLTVFSAIYEDRNVTAVARKLGMSQPAVTFSLNKLRDALSDELFVRTPAGMQPTARATALNGPIRDVIAAIETRILEPPGFDPALSRRQFSLVMSDLSQLVMLPRLLARLSATAPLIDIDCLPIEQEQIAAALEEGAADLALGISALPKGSNVLQQKLFDNPYVCILSRTHPAIGDSLSLDAFLSAEHAVAASLSNIIDPLMRGAGKNLRIRVRSHYFGSLPPIVASSNLIAVVPRALALDWEHKAAIRILPPPFPVPQISVYQFWYRRAHNDPANMWLRKLMAETFLNRDPTLPSNSP